MNTRRRRWSVVVILLGALLPGLALAEPSVGQPLPPFVGTDLTGAQRHSSDLLGHAAVVIAATSRAASGEAQAWSQEVVEHSGGDVPLVTLMAIDLPFFISDGMALDIARGKIPQKYWKRTWLGGEGDIQRALQLEPGSETPYVFTLDAQGHVTAVVHVRVDDPEAARIWQVLRAWRH